MLGGDGRPVSEPLAARSTAFDEARGFSHGRHHSQNSRTHSQRERRLERETGFEPATSTLARSHSTTELFPLARTDNVPHGPVGGKPTARRPIAETLD